MIWTPSSSFVPNELQIVLGSFEDKVIKITFLNIIFTFGGLTDAAEI